MLYTVAYVASLVAANLLVAHFGPGAMPAIAFALIGLDLTLRDYLHDRWRERHLWPRMAALVGIAGALSFALNPATGTIAIASAVAFSLAALADAFVYQWLAERGWIVRANTSNIAGAVVDSALFPIIAFGAFMPTVVLAMITAKVAGGLAWSAVIASVRRAYDLRQA